MFKSKKPDRPYLKVCTKCHGKGQLSHFNQNQDKVYCELLTLRLGFLTLSVPSATVFGVS
jgi:hypothetical protein